MASTGFNFGGTGISSGLFGNKPSTATVAPFSFGAPSSSVSTSGFNLGAATTTTGLTFGAPSSTSVPATSGFSFGLSNTGLFGSGAKTSGTTSSNLFGNLTATTAASGFTLGNTTSSNAGLSFGSFGQTFGSAPSALTASSSSSGGKPVENPKETEVPSILVALSTELEKYIKAQKDVKDEISKVSDAGVGRCKEEIRALKQVIAVVANGIQRDAVAVESLKGDVGQELKNAEIAYRAKDMHSSLVHDYTAPMEYFQRLVYSFENRINTYRQEIEELETFLSTTAPLHEFSPQDLSDVLRRMNDSFLGLAAHLHSVHETAKVLKDKYLYYRRVVYNDMSDPFLARRKLAESQAGKHNSIGPSPFPVMPSAPFTQPLVASSASTATTGFGTQSGISASFFKPTAGQGLVRSLSYDGGPSKPTSSVGSTLQSSLFSTSGLNLSAATQPTLQLQKPPKGKRGKF